MEQNNSSQWNIGDGAWGIGHGKTRQTRREVTSVGLGRTPKGLPQASELRGDTIPNAQCPTPNAQCPMPNAQCPMPNAQCPMPNAQCPIFY
ncbi:hypothetical protein [Nostoc linckia]|uniref:hypothetical protein n=1 Tax=Nostoc linckia TaxID=92942 RepID=UPI00117CD3B5|nr:hypothetical protein [Nostoc linckia]